MRLYNLLKIFNGHVGALTYLLKAPRLGGLLHSVENLNGVTCYLQGRNKVLDIGIETNLVIYVNLVLTG
tara:strand:+ start:252 stop:458 length:207 start_codon:yes stop_codon:yes gene_type:complete